MNLFSFSLQKNGTRTMLERDGMYNVDDMVNKFLPGKLTVFQFMICILLTVLRRRFEY